MTTQAFHLVGVVEARTRAAENDLRRVSGVAQATARSMGSSLGSTERNFLSAGRAASGFLERFAHISNIIQGIPQIGQLAGALTRPLFNAAQEGIKLNMVLEQATIGYSQVAGSEQLALKFLKELQTFGQRSPFRFEGLLQASRLMTAFGFDLDEQIPKLTIWGNAIAASGELSADKIHDVVTAFGQMRMAGRVNAQDMMQLTNANIPGWELLAKAIGKTVAETRKLSEAGRLDGGKAVEAITAMMAIDPRFKDMMARLEKSTAGRLSAAEDLVQFAQAKATRSLTGDISKTLDAALQRGDLADTLAGKIDSAIKPISGALTGAVTAMLTGDADGLKTVAKDVLGSALSSGLTEGIQTGMGSVKEAIGGLVTEGVVNPFKSLLGIQSPSKVFIGFGLNAAEGFNIGFEQGLNDGTFDSIIEKFLGRVEGKLSGPKQRSATNLARLMQREPGFKDKLIAGSRARGINPDHLLNVMAVETAGTFNPAIKNPTSSASGLIQFMAQTAKDLGTTTAELRKMTATQQLDFVFKYFDQFKGRDLSTQGALYAAVGAGRVGRSDQSVLMRAGDRGYAGNAPTWDPNGDGVVRQGEMAMAAISKLGAGVNFTINGSPVTAANPLPVNVVAGAFAGATGGAAGMAQKNKPHTPAAASSSTAAVSDVTAAQVQKVQSIFSKMNQGSEKITSDVNNITTSLVPKTVQAYEQVAAAQQEVVKGAGQWKDVITENEEAIRRLKFDWNAVGAGFESTFQRFLPDLIFEGGKRAGLNFLLGFAQSVGDEGGRQLSAIFSKYLFNFDGGASQSDGGLIGNAVRGLFSKIGLGGKKAPAPAAAATNSAAQTAMGGVAGPAAAGAAQATRNRRAGGTMPASSAGAPGDQVGAGVKPDDIYKATDKVIAGQQAQTAQLGVAISASADRIVDGLTPRQQGFWSGLLGSALSGAVSGAVGSLTGGLFGGGSAQKPDEGPPQPRPTTPPQLKPFKRRALGGTLMRGQAYLFGENGPELGVFAANGTMLPNQHPATQMALNGRAGVTHNHFHFNVHAHGADAAQSIQKSRRQLERQAAQTLSAAARQAA